jgi:hypothetical protein
MTAPITRTRGLSTGEKLELPRIELTESRKTVRTAYYSAAAELGCDPIPSTHLDALIDGLSGAKAVNLVALDSSYWKLCAANFERLRQVVDLVTQDDADLRARLLADAAEVEAHIGHELPNHLRTTSRVQVHSKHYAFGTSPTATPPVGVPAAEGAAIGVDVATAQGAAASAGVPAAEGAAVDADVVSAEGPPIGVGAHAAADTPGDTDPATGASAQPGELRCPPCDKVFTLMANIERAIEVCTLRGTSDTKETLREFFRGTIKRNVIRYMGHVVRKTHDSSVLSALYSTMDPATTVVVRLDFKMKLTPIEWKEAMTSYFGKRGLSCLGICFTKFRAPSTALAAASATGATAPAPSAYEGDMETQFCDYYSNDSKENSNAIAQQLIPALRDYKALHPHIRFAKIISDGAGAFTSSELAAQVALLGASTGITVTDYFVTEAGNGKSKLDGHFAYLMKRLVHTVAAKRGRANIQCAEDAARTASMDGGISATRTFHSNLVRIAPADLLSVEDTTESSAAPSGNPAPTSASSKAATIKGIDSYSWRRYACNPDTMEPVSLSLHHIPLWQPEEPDLVLNSADVAALFPAGVPPGVQPAVLQEYIDGEPVQTASATPVSSPPAGDCATTIESGHVAVATTADNDDQDAGEEPSATTTSPYVSTSVIPRGRPRSNEVNTSEDRQRMQERKDQRHQRRQEKMQANNATKAEEVERVRANSRLHYCPDCTKSFIQEYHLVQHLAAASHQQDVRKLQHPRSAVHRVDDADTDLDWILRQAHFATSTVTMGTTLQQRLTAPPEDETSLRPASYIAALTCWDGTPVPVADYHLPTGFALRTTGTETRMDSKMLWFILFCQGRGDPTVNPNGSKSLPSQCEKAMRLKGKKEGASIFCETDEDVLMMSPNAEDMSEFTFAQQLDVNQWKAQLSRPRPELLASHQRAVQREQEEAKGRPMPYYAVLRKMARAQLPGKYHRLCAHHADDVDPDSIGNCLFAECSWLLGAEPPAALDDIRDVMHHIILHYGMTADDVGLFTQVPAPPPPAAPAGELVAPG